MNPRLKVSAAAIELIKSFEGYRPRSAQLVGGGWTIGYGHTKTARADAEVSPSDAEALLIYDLMEVQTAVNDWIFTPLSQNQYDALVAFAFNVGLDNFRRSSVLRRVNEGNMVQAACALEMWRKADLDGERIVVDALVRRRAAEKTLFLTPASGWTPAPSPIVRPRVDYDVGLSLPKSSAEVSVSMNGPRGEAHRAADPSAGPAAAAEVDAAAERLQAIAADPGQFAESEAGIDLTPAPAPPREDLAPLPEPSRTPVLAERHEAPSIAAPEPAAVPPPPPVIAPSTLTLLTIPASDSRGAPVPSAPVSPPAPREDFILTSPPEAMSEPPPRPEDAPPPIVVAAPAAARLFDEAPLDIPSHIANSDTSRRIVRREAPIEVEDSPGFDGRPARFGGIHLLVLGLLGLAVFAGSVFWGINAKGSGGLLDPMIVASVLGMVGIGLVASAVYFLLVRLGGRGE